MVHLASISTDSAVTLPSLPSLAPPILPPNVTHTATVGIEKKFDKNHLITYQNNRTQDLEAYGSQKTNGGGGAESIDLTVQNAPIKSRVHLDNVANTVTVQILKDGKEHMVEYAYKPVNTRVDPNRHEWIKSPDTPGPNLIVSSNTSTPGDTKQIPRVTLKLGTQSIELIGSSTGGDFEVKVAGKDSVATLQAIGQSGSPLWNRAKQGAEPPVPGYVNVRVQKQGKTHEIAPVSKALQADIQLMENAWKGKGGKEIFKALQGNNVEQNKQLERYFNYLHAGRNIPAIEPPIRHADITPGQANFRTVLYDNLQQRDDRDLARAEAYLINGDTPAVRGAVEVNVEVTAALNPDEGKILKILESLSSQQRDVLAKTFYFIEGFRKNMQGYTWPNPPQKVADQKLLDMLGHRDLGNLSDEELKKARQLLNS